LTLLDQARLTRARSRSAPGVQGMFGNLSERAIESGIAAVADLLR
jgi:hypothetical protein